MRSASAESTARTAPALPLYPYQQRWIADRSRFKIGMFARQSGKTFATTLEIVDDCFEAEARGGRTRWVILSRGARQAEEAMDEGVKLHAAAYGMAFESLEEEIVLSDGKTKVKALEVVFPGGSRITALPANPDTARGFSANVFLDEFAFHRDSRAIWRALFPVISNGYRIVVTSTPNGKGNKFHDLITGKDDEWSRHIVDIYRAVADGLPRNVQQLRAALKDEDAWAQEFELKFLDEALAWLSYELISAVEHPDAGRPELYAGGNCFAGVDIGRRKNLFVLWIDEEVGDVLWNRERIELRNRTFAEQDAALDGAFVRYRILRVCMDQTGMGEKPVEDAQRRHGTLRVEGVLMTPTNMLRLATIGKERFEDRRLRIPEGQPELRADLHKLKKIAGPTGVPRFVAENDDDDHADRTWACFLSAAAAAGPRVPIEHRATGVQRIGAQLDDFIGA